MHAGWRAAACTWIGVDRCNCEKKTDFGSSQTMMLLTVLSLFVASAAAYKCGPIVPSTIVLEDDVFPPQWRRTGSWLPLRRGPTFWFTLTTTRLSFNARTMSRTCGNCVANAIRFFSLISTWPLCSSTMSSTFSVSTPTFATCAHFPANSTPRAGNTRPRSGRAGRSRQQYGLRSCGAREQSHRPADVV